MPPTTTTNRKDAPAEPEFSLEQFEAWDQDAEDAAVAAIADAFKYIVVEGNFVGRFGDGDVVKIPLEFEASVFEGLDETASGMAQLKEILTALGDAETAERIMSKPFPQMAACAALYFEVVERVTNTTISRFKRASLGE